MSIFLTYMMLGKFKSVGTTLGFMENQSFYLLYIFYVHNILEKYVLLLTRTLYKTTMLRQSSAKDLTVLIRPVKK